MNDLHDDLNTWSQDELFHAGYYNTLDQIYHSQWTIARLSRIELLRRSIQQLWPQGHPTRFIHVAGTSGKGSTCRFLERGLSLVGKAGAFMGPHIFDYRERFSIAETMVPHAEITEAWERRIRPHSLQLAMANEQHALSFHEVNILVALALFEKHRVEWAALETGVGGRYDQTMALDVAASLITNVGRDHEHLLGSEQWQRALDKSGIARPAVPLFTSEQDPPTTRVIAATCQEVQAPLFCVDRAGVDALRVMIPEASNGALPPDSLLLAEHQHWNAALSLLVLTHLFPHLAPRRIVEQFLSTRLTGRGWPVRTGIYADIAHNPEEMAALVQTVKQRFAEQGKIFIVGVSRKRSPAEMFAPLAGVARVVIVVGSFFADQDPYLVKEAIQHHCPTIPVLVVSSARKALAMAQSLRKQGRDAGEATETSDPTDTMGTADDVIILTGSTYMIDQILNTDPHLRHLNATFGWRVGHTLKT